MEKNKEYYDNLDKRTTEYKEWKKEQNIQPHEPVNKPSEGLGDTIEKITKATGIDKLVKFVAGEDCGCDERKKKLNKIFNYNRKPNCLSETDYKWLDNFFKSNPRVIKPSDQKVANEIHEKTFNYKEGNCDGCVRTMMNNLKTVYEAYK